MSRISDVFNNNKAFIAYLMAGDPSIEQTKQHIIALEKGGADLIEIGIPFSDPIAEGDVIQKASLRALDAGTNIKQIFEMVDSLKDIVKIPLLFMTYANPVFNYGYDDFFKRCADCGISGVIIPDLPFEEQGEVKSAKDKNNIEMITLLAPTSDKRTKLISENSEGFIYLVSSMGVTGMRDSIVTDIKTVTDDIRKYTKTPVAVGFGIHSPEQAKDISAIADGVIVGSAIVQIINENGENACQKLTEYVKSMKAEM